jgi:hypothetical protein
MAIGGDRGKAATTDEESESARHEAKDEEMSDARTN